MVMVFHPNFEMHLNFQRIKNTKKKKKTYLTLFFKKKEKKS
jgi:hypothetical protein